MCRDGDAAMGEDTAPRRIRRVLVCGWGAAAERVLEELAVYMGKGVAVVSCISHLSQASDCDLREVCRRLGVDSCVLHDDNNQIFDVASNFRPDFIVSASYRKKLPKRVLDLAPDCINFHPALLPKHRGCWSGFWSIFEGDTETGVTCHRMVEKFDEGLLLHQEKTPILSDDTSASILKKLLPVTAACAKSVLADYFGSGLHAGEEQRGDISYHFRELPFGGLVQPEWADDQVERFIRAMHFPPFEGATVLIGGKRVEVCSVDSYQNLRHQADDIVATSTGGRDGTCQ